MRTRILAFLLASIIICSLCTACGSPTSADGTWYSVVDATMYNFSNGQITVAGVVVGQYEQDKDVVVISLTADAKNNKLYITKLDGIEVLADVREGEGTVFFCRGLDNAERMIYEAEQREKTMLWNFRKYIGEHLVGEWIPIKDNADYKSIVVTSDGTITFTKQNGDVWVQHLIFTPLGIPKISDIVMENRGYSSPTTTLYMSNDGTEVGVNKMSVFACPETYSADYPALGFYGWTYKKVK